MKDFYNNGYDTVDPLNAPDWKEGSVEVEFTFRNSMKKSVTINTEGMTDEEIDGIRNQLLGKIKLVQNMFEHGTHGQITVQGVTVRADDLSAVKVR